MAATKRLSVAQRAIRLREWIELYSSGHSFEEIAEQYNCTKQNVHNIVTAELRKRADQSVDDWRAKLIERHELVIKNLLPRAAQGDPQAAAQLLRAYEQQAKLTGANAVQTQKLEVSNPGSIDDEIQRLLGELDTPSSPPTKTQASDQGV